MFIWKEQLKRSNYYLQKHINLRKPTFDVGVVEESVQIRQQVVPDVQNVTWPLGENVAKSGGVLLAVAETVVVAGEGVEGSELHPSHAQLLVRVPVESANVGSDLLYINL